MQPFETALSFAHTLDAQDTLSHFREKFVHADPEMIYLDGNSLGRLPLATQERMHQVIEHEWGERLIRGWNEGWITAVSRIGNKVAQLIGAQADEVLMADSTSVNLYKLAMAAVMKQNGRSKIITDNLNFPSDLYILQGIASVMGCQLQVIESADGIHGPVAALAQAIDQNTALVALSHTVFKSGYTYDMTAVTELAHRAGALILWDLSHSVGSVPVYLNAAHADLAVGCTYKYLNGGPGAPAFLYVRHDLQHQLHNPISGWMGQKGMFEFGLTYEPAPGLSRFLTGTPNILSLLAAEPGIELHLQAGIEPLRVKSMQQSEYLVYLWQEILAPLGFTLNSPRAVSQRGSHLSLGHPEGWRIDQALIHDMKVLPDFRKPDNIRLGIAPIYNTFADIRTAVSRLQTVVVEKLYEKYNPENLAVT